MATVADYFTTDNLPVINTVVIITYKVRRGGKSNYFLFCSAIQLNACSAIYFQVFFLDG